MSTFELSDSIAERIYTIMKRKGISNSQLAKMTGRKPSEVTKWLGGGHNFTCKTIVLISNALGEDLIRVVKTKK
jgi:transcriptional regulator with XRE-family HTH domain